MKKSMHYLLIGMLILILSLSIDSMSANAANVKTGTLGTNKGVQWTYDEDTRTLTLTGEDEGLETSIDSYGRIRTICMDVEKIVLQDFTPVGSVRNLFSGLVYLKTVEVNNVDTSKVTDMSYMFYECNALTTLDVSGFDTSKVTDMSYMFYECNALTTLDVSGFDTSKVTDMSEMFYRCNALTTLDVSGFDTSKVTDMRVMFYNCRRLKTLDVGDFDTSNVTDMSWMFYDCAGLKTLDVSKFDTSKVTNMGRMFSGCRALTLLDVSKFDTSKVTNMEGMFSGCVLLTTLDVSKFDTSKVTGMGGMFNSCNALTTLDVRGFDTSNVKIMTDMFNGCKLLTVLDVRGFDTSNVTNMYSMFKSCSSLTSLDVTQFDTSNVKNMARMFANCYKVESLDVSGFNTAKVTDMHDMFRTCAGITELDLSNFDTSNVTKMQYMFESCTNLESLDVSSFDTSKVTDMESMFRSCGSLTSLDVSGFDTANVTNMKYMFYFCSSLIALDVSGFDTANVANAKYMFDNCRNLKVLDLRNFDTVKATDAQDMLSGLNSLEMLRTPKAMASGQVIALPETLRDSAGKKVSEINSSLCGTTLYKYLVELNAEKTQIPVDSKLQLKIKVNGVEQGVTDNTNYQWTSSATKVATVSDKGIVTAVSPGTVTITCTRENRNTAIYQLEIIEKLAIKSQPQSATVTEGESATFKVTAVGGGLKYQWQYKPDGTNEWKNSGITGAKTASLTVQGIMTRNGQQYRCIITDGSGSKVTSNAVTLAVTEKLAITGQPTNQTVEEGESAVFKVTAKGSNLSYQWQYKLPGGSTWSNSGITGAKTASLTVQGIMTRNGQQYRCIITDGGGSKVTSNAVTLAVTEKLAITGQPTNQTVEEGESAVFKVTAKGSNLSYQWQYKLPGGSTWSNSGITGAKTAGLTVQGIMTRNGQQYRCIITDGSGNKVTSNAVVLMIEEKLTITNQPSSQTVAEGANAVFKITAKGTNLSYQWQYKNVGANKWINSGMKGAKTASLTVQGTAARNGQQYRCIITDGSGNTVTSEAVTLTVEFRFAITAQPVNQSVSEGANAVFTVTATGSNLSYRWQYKNAGADKWINSGMKGAKTTSITVQGTAARNGQQYRCIVTDGTGNTVTSDAATLTVN